MTQPRVQLGDLCRHLITGFTGICIARTEWLNGCWRVNLQPEKLDKDGKIQDTICFDEPEVAVVKAAKVKTLANAEPVGSKTTGGPRDIATRGAAAARR